jgi:hypothetical protein
MAAAAPYIAMALAAGATAKNQHDVAKQQDEIAAQGIATQSAKEREAADRVNAEIGTLGKSNPNAERQAASTNFMQQLQRNRGAEAAPRFDAASGRYGEDVETQTAASDTQASRIADLMSRIESPALQRQREGFGFGRLSSDLNRVGSESAGQDFLTQLRMRAVQPNPWIAAGGSAAGAYAGASASKTPTTTTTANPNDPRFSRVMDTPPRRVADPYNA